MRFAGENLALDILVFYWVTSENEFGKIESKTDGLEKGVGIQGFFSIIR